LISFELKPTSERRGVVILKVIVVQDDRETGACFEAMRSLRHDLKTRNRFVEQISRQRREAGYVLLAARDEQHNILGVAGFRVLENLMHGVHIYVDDLVTLEQYRGRGVGTELMRLILSRARDIRCKKILLDTGTENEMAHLFYSRLGFSKTAYRFSKIVADSPSDQVRST
jgi:ribosomal protein S18 acetylase RimI-like enzyme